MKNSNFSQILYIFALLSSLQLQAQNITGIWEVIEERAGTADLEPDARWYQIQEDSAYTAGYGWLQTEKGQWSWNPKVNAFWPKAEIAIQKRFGPYKVTFESKEEMYWQREEDGITKTLRLQKRKNIPQSVRDQMAGIWQLINVKKGNEDITADWDAEAQHYIYLNWNQRLIERLPDASLHPGYWFHEARSSNDFVQFFYTGSERPSIKWKVNVKDDELTLIRAISSVRKEQRTYKRIQQLPNDN